MGMFHCSTLMLQARIGRNLLISPKATSGDIYLRYYCRTLQPVWCTVQSNKGKTWCYTEFCSSMASLFGGNVFSITVLYCQIGSTKLI